MSDNQEQQVEEFNPLTAVVDLTPYHDNQFLVAISTGDRDKGKFLCSTIRGPYSFDEMIGEVGDMNASDQNNAKVYILEKNRKKKAIFFDKNTTEYIQFNYQDILMDRMLGGAFDKKVTHQAGVIEAEDK
jgi:hypothetical protein